MRKEIQSEGCRAEQGASPSEGVLQASVEPGFPSPLPVHRAVRDEGCGVVGGSGGDDSSVSSGGVVAGRWRLIPALPLLLLVRLYRYAISPFMPRCCRFHPSCSAYAEEALVRHGLLRGGWLAVRRLARCHPFCEGGVDPVPPVTDECREKKTI